MKKVLIVIPDMGIGGAQKSLLSFLQCFAESDVKENYDIDLIVVRQGGAFQKQLPNNVNLISTPPILKWMGSHFSMSLFKECFSFKGLLGELCWILKSRLKLLDNRLNRQQNLWECWKNFVPTLEKEYDVAVSYLDGFSNYYVIDKVLANKKVIWLHNEYQKQEYSAEHDKAYYNKADAVITISEKCKECILNEFPELDEKTYIFENITSAKDVVEKANKGAAVYFKNFSGLKILTVGRLNPQKGIDLAITAARYLKFAGIKFIWIVLGDGPERTSLEHLIKENSVEDCFVLAGAIDNPYVYMKECDIFVQSSRFEGKSIVLDEAKILCKPIVVTDYTTVANSITNREDGLIVNMTGEEIARGILELENNHELKAHIVSNLQQKPKGNEQELKKYLDIML